jgi:uncharacterized protein (DUF433 family)
MSPIQLAEAYDLTQTQVNDALSFYTAYQAAIDQAIATEQALESVR